MRWEHVSLTFGRKRIPSGAVIPWTSASQEQMEAVKTLQRASFECAATTTLTNGCLFLMFKRPAEDAQPLPEIEELDDLAYGRFGYL